MKAHYYASYQQPHQHYILDFKQGDVNGDSIIDDVFLVGRKTNPDEIFTDNISIIIRNGRTNQSLKIPLGDIGGYNGQLFLTNFASKNKADILVSIDTGGSGRYIYAYLYTMKNNIPILLFDWDKFNGSSMYSAKFKDDFKVEIVSQDGDTTYIIDVHSNKKMYMDAGIYNENGKLLKPIEGGVLALGALFPVVTHYNGVYQLLALQRIIGINNADNLGAVQTYLKWDGKNLIPDRVQVVIM